MAPKFLVYKNPFLDFLEYRYIATIIMVKAVCNVAANGKKCDGSPETGEVRGQVTMEQEEGGNCMISWKITGLTPGKHGFHIHETADFSDGCKR